MLKISEVKARRGDREETVTSECLTFTPSNQDICERKAKETQKNDCKYINLARKSDEATGRKHTVSLEVALS